MKIITWNCNMAFRKKAHLLLAQNPDILIIPECENLQKLAFPANCPIPSGRLGFGENPNKGLGIFSFNNVKLKLRRNYNPALKFIIPVSVRKAELHFNLFAIWANNPGDPDGQYVEQTWKAIHHYSKYLKKNTILAGDFNSNTIWDRKNRAGNHSNVVQKLARKKIVSAYHLFYKQVQGAEQHPTFYLYKHRDKPYHLDYCFVSGDIADRIRTVEIGEFDYWMKYSDHVPVSINFED